jgi:integrase
MPTDRDKAIVRLMAYAGLRFSEVAGLHSHRVDLGRQRLIVVETLRRDMSVKPVPKSTAGQRFVPLGPELVAMLEPMLGEGLVFPGLAYTNWRRRVFVPTPHDLRHTFGSWLAGGGVSPTDIMALMGHSTLRATERYLHSSEDRFARARLALPVRQIGA